MVAQVRPIGGEEADMATADISHLTLTTPPFPAVEALRQRLDLVQRPALDPDATRTSTILIVDAVDLNRRLLRGMLKAAPYRVLEASRAADALAILGREPVDLVVLDLVMPDMSGPEFCHRLKSNRRTQFVPILILTSVLGIENEIKGLASGADEFLLMPLHPDVVRARIRAMLRNKAAVDSLEEAETILFALARMVESRDQATGAHCERVAQYSVALGAAMGLPDADLQALYRGGFLHDIGKVCVPDSILFKRGALTDEEWVVMRSHTVRGEEVCRPMKSLVSVLPVIRNHHERWNGSGYPDGLAGEKIPLLARVFQVADIYDALTTARSYKPAFSIEESLGKLEDEVRRGWRDPELVSLFRECIAGAPAPRDGVVLPESLGPESVLPSLKNMQRHLE
jgi:putative two-component system response regulator